jgi:hypothetical protein
MFLKQGQLHSILDVHKMQTQKLNALSMTSIWLVLISSVLISLIVVYTDGDMFSAGAFLALITIVFVSFYHLDWGFNIFIGMVLLFDQFRIPRFEPFTVKVQYFRNLKETYLSGMDFAVINPLELHMFLLIFVWLIILATKKQSSVVRVPVWPIAVLFFIWLGYSFVYGLTSNGDLLPALWELRALFYLGVMYFFVPQIIQDKQQLKNLIWVCIGAISFKALQGVARFVRLGFSSEGAPSLTNHEDPLFFVSLIILFFGLVLFKVDSRQRSILKWMVIPLIIGFFVAQRRATYGGFAVALIAFIVLLPSVNRAKLLKIVLPGIAVFGLYLAIFWNSTSSAGYTAQILKSAFSKEEEFTGDRYYSNLYRDYEKYNLAVTVRNAPVTGIGFGKKYDMPLELWFIPYTLRDYIPHNEILWLLVKTGAIGFFLFFLFLNSYLFYASSVFSHLNDSYLKAVCAIAIVAVVSQVVVSYYDLQLTYYRNMIYLGVLMGLVPVFELIDKQSNNTIVG